MKTLSMIAIVLLATAAHADYVRYESVTFQRNSMWVPANKTCVFDGNIYIKSGMTIRVQDCRGDHGGGCVWKKQIVTPQPVVDTFYRSGNCHGDHGDRNCADVPYTVDQSVMPVYKVSGHGDSERRIGYYRIPACPSGPTDLESSL